MRGQQTRLILIILTSVAIFAIAAVPVATAGQSKRAKIVDLGPVIQDGGANGINKHGEVVGTVVALNGTQEAFLYSHGVETGLGTLGGSTSQAFGINERGHVVGTSGMSGGSAHAFLYTAGHMQDLGTLGGSASGGYAINDSEEVVGHSSLAGDQEFHPFLWANGHMMDLGSLGGNGFALGINKLGQIVGFSFQSGNQNYRAFVYQKGVMSDLGTLGGVFSYARAINNRGNIVGFADPGDGTAQMAEAVLKEHLWHKRHEKKEQAMGSYRRKS